MEHFYVDVSKVPSAPWNACAAEVFITAFLDAHADEPVVTAIQPTRCDIMRLFTSNFRTGRRKAATEALSDEARSAILRDKRRRERKRWVSRMPIMTWGVLLTFAVDLLLPYPCCPAVSRNNPLRQTCRVIRR